jgi:hypothetical protein
MPQRSGIDIAQFPMDDLIDKATRVRDQEINKLLGLSGIGMQSKDLKSNTDFKPKQGVSKTQGITSSTDSSPSLEEDEAFDEADFNRWLASTRTAGVNTILFQDDMDDDSLPATNEDTHDSTRKPSSQKATGRSS